MAIHSEGINPTDSEKLIDEAAKAMFEVDQKMPWPMESTASLTDFKDMARAALAVFEKAHTPTDDEREALRAEVEQVQRAAWAEIHGQDPTRTYSVAEVKKLVYSFDNLISSVLRRSEAPEPSAEAQALVDAVQEAMDRYSETANLDGEDSPISWIPVIRIEEAIDSVPLPFVTEPQGEPSDAQAERERIIADLREWSRPLGSSPEEETLRLVIERIERAAGGVR